MKYINFILGCVVRSNQVLINRSHPSCEALNFHVMDFQVIVWDEQLIGQVGLIADVLFLKELGVHKMVRLPTPNLTEEYKDLNEFFFFVRPQLCFVEQIMDAIRYLPILSMLV